MKVVLFEKYGSPDVLQFKEVEKPTPSEDQVLVKIHAASANPLDWHIMRGAPYLVRLDMGLRKPKEPTILGADIAGQVEAVGSNVTEFKVGDEVFGGAGVGGFAEYACFKEKGLALKPTNLSFEDAASIPTVAFTALQGLQAGNIQAGQKVLINGASGGIGTIAVQIAKSLGAVVTGVCSGRNVDLVRSLGADHVIDYTKQNFTKMGQKYDLILDTIGNHSLSAYRRALTSDGMCISVGFSTIFHMFRIKLFGNRGGQPIISVRAKRAKSDLLIIKEMLETGKIKAVIDKCYSFSEIPDAIRYLETSRARGKVVITL
jgi:NADPH:quinone reductase-like Zn-dependent oxidoreductase